MRSLFILPFILLFSCSAEPPPAGGAAGGGGSGLLYFSTNVTYDVFKVDLATGDAAKLGTGVDPHSTPEGKLIFATPIDLVESDETMASHRIIVEHDNSGMKPWTTGFQSPQLSPDGTKIVYTTLLDDLYVVSRADGSVLNTHRAMSAGGWIRPMWTPDGRIVVGGGFTNKGLYISDESLSTFTRFDPMLADPKQPAVSKDGTKVAFVLNTRLHVINIDGTGLKRIDESDDKAEEPAFSPDGQKVVYRVSGLIKIISADGAARGTDLFAMHPSLKDKWRNSPGSALQWK